MKILVLSDIHAFTKVRENGLKPSYVHVGDESSSLAAFEKIAKAPGFPHFDVLVCPGDMGDQADQACIQYVWQSLKRIADTKGAALLGTVGNHDLDSRYNESFFDAKGILNSLDPNFPSLTTASCFNGASDLERQLWFWARNFYLYSIPETRFLVLNSAAYHGMGKPEMSLRELDHGRISNNTLELMKAAINQDNAARREASVDDPKINILVCHHHLVKDGGITDPDYSQMTGSQELIDFLSDSDFGRWLVIHGHRHRGRLLQPPSSTGPYILSAASFGATRDQDYSNTSPNQIHLIEFDFAAMNTHKFIPAGHIKSWSYVLPIGWQSEAHVSGGLPPVTGFGFRGSIDVIASAIADKITDDQISAKWSDLLDIDASYRFLDYEQLGELKKVLRNSYQLDLSFSDKKIPQYVTRTG